jgi:hypothetical protein
MIDEKEDGHSSIVGLIVGAPTVRSALELYHTLTDIGIKIIFEDFLEYFNIYFIHGYVFIYDLYYGSKIY